MDSQDQQQLREKIHQRLTELVQEHSDPGPTPERLSDQQEDEDARMDILAQASVDEALQGHLALELRQLKANLEWLDSDLGGLCSSCGEPIPIRRLLAVPTTRHCVECSAQKES